MAAQTACCSIHRILWHWRYYHAGELVVPLAQLGSAQTSRRFRPSLDVLEDRCLLSTIFTVDTTADSGPGSLRQAILDANATANTDSDGNGIIEADEIRFAIPGAGKRNVAGGSLPKQAPAGPAPPRRSVCAPGRAIPRIRRP